MLLSSKSTGLFISKTGGNIAFATLAAYPSFNSLNHSNYVLSCPNSFVINNIIDRP